MTETAADDWLSVPSPPAAPPREKFLAPEPTQPRGDYIPRGETLDGKRREFVLLKRRLKPAMRVFLDCLVIAHFNVGDAHALMKKRGYETVKETLYRWRQRPDLKRAIELAEETALDVAGASAAKVLIDMNRLAEYGATEVPLRNRKGEIVKTTTEHGAEIPVKVMRSPEIAFKAVELLGKNKKLWGNDQTQQLVTLQLVDLTGSPAREARVIEAEAVGE